MILGIDPNTTGAITLLRRNGELVCHDIEKSVVQAIRFIREHREEIEGAVIEHAQSFGQEGRASLVKFCMCRGSLWGALIALQIPILNEPLPLAWKQAVGIACNPPPRLQKGASDEEKVARRRAMAVYNAGQKTKARERAAALFPQGANLFSRVKDADRAESALMAFYGKLIHGKER